MEFGHYEELDARLRAQECALEALLPMLRPEASSAFLSAYSNSIALLAETAEEAGCSESWTAKFLRAAAGVKEAVGKSGLL